MFVQIALSFDISDTNKGSTVYRERDS